MKQLLLLITSVLLLSAGCKKNKPTEPAKAEDQLPPETQTGANTFGCKVNGKVWLPKGGIYTPRLSADFFSPTQITIYANKRELINGGPETKIEGINFSIFNDTVKIGQYFFDDTLKRKATFNTDNGRCYYKTFVNDQSGLTITFLDLANRIISGRFQLSFPAQNTCPPIEITEGRFDIKY